MCVKSILKKEGEIMENKWKILEKILDNTRDDDVTWCHD